MVYLVMIPLGINGGDQDKYRANELMIIMFRFVGELPGPRKKQTDSKYFKIHYLTVFICSHYNISRWSFTNIGRCTKITEIVSVW